MMTFKQFIVEGINDAGIFKALFVVGIPGAGKSYTVSKIKGAISPRVVNTDIATEYLIDKTGLPGTSQNWPIFRNTAIRITKGALTNYLNGALPLIIDGTSNNTSNILSRTGILESLGYDVGMVFVNSSLEKAIERAAERAKETNRTVDEDVIRQMYEQSAVNKEYLKSRYSFFHEIDNDGELSNEALSNLFKKVQGFFRSELQNPIGQRAVKKLTETKQKELVPTIISRDELVHRVNGWYRSA